MSSRVPNSLRVSSRNGVDDVVGRFEEWETKAYQEAYMAWRMGHNQLVEPHLEGFGITYADVKHTY